LTSQTADKPRRFSECTYEQLDEKQKAVAEVMKQKTLSGISGGVTGFYAMLAMVLNTAEIQLSAAAAGAVKPFKPAPR
jgi:precorrin-3B methylase